MKQVLIVDDEFDIIDILQDILKPHFDQILSANNANDALEILQKNDIRIVLSDFHMPGIEGDELVRKIRALGLQTPVIFITGDASRELAMSSLRLGVADILEKPFNSEDVVTVVNRVLEIEKRKKNIYEVEQKQDKSAAEKHKKVLGLLQAVNDKKRVS